jgi:uracil-DNA glycosylase family 4
MEGFFTIAETKSKSRPKGKICSCASCGLGSKCLTPKFPPYGNFKKGILIVGETPSEIDDRAGIPWQGKSGKLLQRTLEGLGIDLYEDCLTTHACKCHLIDDRLPSNHEVDCCRKSVLQTVDTYMPKLILLLGTSAIYSLLGHRWKRDLEGILKWRGWTIPDQDLKAWVCPIFHPSFVNQRKDGVEEVIWIQDLESAIEKLNDPFPKYKEPKIEVIEDLSVLDNIQSDMVAFDYETTGLKPHAKGHRIVCCSVADTVDHVYVFLMPDTKLGRKPFLRLLENPRISKMAHNIKFEDTWSKVRLKQDVFWWQWDSMLAAHILDNRPGITGLKFQAYVQFGIIDYSSELDPYLHSGGNSANDFNKIFDLIKTEDGVDKLLHYCALDSVYEYRLAMLQMKIMNYNFLPF